MATPRRHPSPFLDQILYPKPAKAETETPVDCFKDQTGNPGLHKASLLLFDFFFGLSVLHASIKFGVLNSAFTLASVAHINLRHINWLTHFGTLVTERLYYESILQSLLYRVLPFLLLQEWEVVSLHSLHKFTRLMDLFARLNCFCFT